MNIKYEAKYKAMLESCDSMSQYEPKGSSVSNAFHLIESHLRGQFTYDFNIAPESLTGDNNAINTIITKLEIFCEKLKDDLEKKNSTQV